MMKDLLNPWVIVGAVVFASLLLMISFYAAGTILPATQNEYTGDAGITVIPIPTYTKTPIPTKPSVTATTEPEFDIQVGGYVQISGTEGEGLRLRLEPTLNGKIIYLGLEGEIFFVSDGPQESDGYLWWQLVAPLNESRTGWAVSNYLIPAKGP